MEWEVKILESIQHWHHPFWDEFFKFSNWVGRGERIAIFIIIGVWRHLANRERAWAIFWPITGVSILIFIKGLKKLFGRERPDLWEHIIHIDPGSMPSGHAVAASLFLPLLAIYWSRKQPQWKIPLWVATGLGIIWIDLGRLYLGVHYPTDIMAGFAMGAMITTALYFMILKKTSFAVMTKPERLSGLSQKSSAE